MIRGSLIHDLLATKFSPSSIVSECPDFVINLDLDAGAGDLGRPSMRVGAESQL